MPPATGENAEYIMRSRHSTGHDGERTGGCHLLMSAIALHDTAEKYFYHALDRQEQPAAQTAAALLLHGQASAQAAGADKMIS